MIAIPLYFENAYFNMLAAKEHIYVAGAILYLAAIVISCICEQNRRACIPQKKGLDWSLFLFAVSALFSCLLSGDIRASFWGSEGWRVGAFVIITFAVFYQVLSKYLQLRQNMWLPVLIVNMVIFVIGIFHSAGIDILSLHENIVPNQYFWYISTIGNVNWYVGYLCLIVPMVAVFYFSCEDLFSRGIYLVFLMLACLNLVLCGSDGVYLGFGVCAFFAIPYAAADGQRMCRLSELMIGYAGALLLVRFCPFFSDRLANIEGISRWFLEPEISGSICALAIFTRWYAGDRWGNFSEKQKKWIIIILEIMLGCCATAFFIDSVVNFGDDWGTNRGRTWKYCMTMFREFPLKQRLFGLGPEMLGMYFKELSTYFSRQILVAHSEPLQILMTMGIAGLFCWCSVWGSVLGCYFKDKLWQRDSIAFYLPLIAYMAQSFVNSPQPTNVAVLCIIMACYRKSETMI